METVEGLQALLSPLGGLFVAGRLPFAGELDGALQGETGRIGLAVGRKGFSQHQMVWRYSGARTTAV